MYKTLLPLNALASERALEQASAEQILALPVPIRHVKDPATCPAHLLPWLAWEYAVDYWNPEWDEAQKRCSVCSSTSRNRGRSATLVKRCGATDHSGGVVARSTKTSAVYIPH
nr:phage tail protein I [Hafnia paralvei]